MSLRLCCDASKRAGSYKLAWLAVKYGAESLLIGGFDCEVIGRLPVAAWDVRSAL